MGSTYTDKLRLEKQATGENDSTWGDRANTVFDLIDDAVAGMVTINTTGGTTTLTANNSASDQARMAIIKVTGALVSNAILQIPAKSKKYVVWNATTNAYTVTVKTAGGAAVTCPQGKKMSIFCDGTDCYSAHDAPPTESKELGIACSDETTALTTGTAKTTFRMPCAMSLTEVRASLTTAQTSGSIFTVDINEGGVSILSVKLTIDNGEKTSTTAATLPTISDAALADDAEITIDIDQVGDGTAKGLKVYLIGTKA